MSQFTPSITKEYEFDGDTVTVKFARLKRKHMLKVLPWAQAIPEKDGDELTEEQKKKGDVAVQEMLTLMLDILPEYIQEFRGLRDSDGNAVEFSTAIDEVYFMELITDIATDLFRESIIDPKKKAAR